MRERAYVSMVAEDIVAVALVAALKLSPTAIDQSSVHDCRPVTMTVTVTMISHMALAPQPYVNRSQSNQKMHESRMRDKRM